MFLNKFFKFTNNEDKKILFDILCNIVPFWIENILKNEIYVLDDVQDARNFEKQRNKEISGLEIVKGV